METVNATGNVGQINNVMRHHYRVLTDDEKFSMQSIKDQGLAFWQLIDLIGDSREIALAKTKIEEAVMWATKHITA